MDTLFIDLFSSSALTIGAWGFLSLLKRPSTLPDAEGKYLWKQIYNAKKCAFICPKCLYKSTAQPKICECDLHDKSHFHYKCDRDMSYHACDAVILVRTHDDC